MTKRKLESLLPGDVVWAKRYYKESERTKFREGHREGPFIIFKKNNDGSALGFFCSTTPMTDDCITLENLEPVGLYRHTSILFMLKPITKFTYIRYVSTLPSDFFEDLKRQLALHRNKQTKSFQPFSSFNIKPDIGDVVETPRHHRCYIYENTNNKGVKLAYPIAITKKNEPYDIMLNNIPYRFNFKASFGLNISNLNFMNFADNLQQEAIAKKAAIYNDRTIKVGTVCEDSTGLYYIFGEFKGNWQGYKLVINNNPPSKKKKIKDDGRAYIKINNQGYNIDLNPINIVSSSCIFQFNTTDDERRMIKDLHNLYKSPSLSGSEIKFLKKFKKKAIIYNQCTRKYFRILEKIGNNSFLIEPLDSNDKPFQITIKDTKTEYRVNKSLTIYDLIDKFPLKFQKEKEEMIANLPYVKEVIISPERDLLKEQIIAICEKFGVPYIATYNDEGNINFFYEDVPEYGKGPQDGEILPELTLWPQINKETIKNELTDLFHELKYEYVPMVLSDSEYKMIKETFG